MQLLITEIRSEGNVRLENPESNGLADSMRAVGQITPITVRAHEDGTYVVVSGHRRLAAAQELGWETIEAYVKMDDNVALAMQIAENVARQDLQPFEYAQGVLALRTEGNMTQAAIAAALGVDKKVVSELQKVAKGTEGMDPTQMNQLSWDELEIFGEVHDMPPAIREQFVETMDGIERSEMYWTVNNYVEEVHVWRWAQKKENKALVQVMADIGAIEMEREDVYAAQYLEDAALAAHRGEPCHGYRIRKAWDQRSYDYVLDEYCLDPGSHESSEKPELAEMAEKKPMTRQISNEANANKERRRQKLLRKEAVLSFSGKPKMRELTEMLYQFTLNTQAPYKWQELGKTYGLTKPKEEFHFDWNQYLDDFEGKDKLVQQLILAIGSWYLTLQPSYAVGRSETLDKMDALFGVVVEEESPEEVDEEE